MRRYIVFLFIGFLCISLNKTNAQKEVRTNRVNQQERFDSSRFTLSHGAIVRGDSTKKSLALVFTADEFGEGLQYIEQTLRREKVKGSFFFTGRFYRNKQFQSSIKQLYHSNHYLGPHSDQHLLYCDWIKRDSLLVTKDSFENDIGKNLKTIRGLGIKTSSKRYLIPPFEWWNDTIAKWSKANRLILFNFTPGIRSNADYTYPELGNAYKSSEWIMDWLKDFINTNPEKLNGSIILIHAGTDPRRKDKFYKQLPAVIHLLKEKGFQIMRIDELLR